MSQSSFKGNCTHTLESTRPRKMPRSRPSPTKLFSCDAAARAVSARHSPRSTAVSVRNDASTAPISRTEWPGGREGVRVHVWDALCATCMLVANHDERTTPRRKARALHTETFRLPENPHINTIPSAGGTRKNQRSKRAERSSWDHAGSHRGTRSSSVRANAEYDWTVGPRSK